MKNALILSLTLACVAVAAQTPKPPPPVLVAFTNVNVLPMDRDTVLRDQTVLVREGKIAEVGSASNVRVPAGAVRVEGKGKFLIPAIAEMHAHIPGGNAPAELVERTLFLYAANGLSTIRGMLGDPRHLEYRESRGEGRVVQPAHLHVGPVFQRKNGDDTGSGRQDGRGPESRRLRSAEDSPRGLTRGVRRACGQG